VYLVAAALARAFPRTELGPDEVERRNRETVAEVARGLLAGARHVRETPDVAQGLAVIGVHRLGYGLGVVCTVLLYRNHFHPDGIFRAGLGGLTQVVGAVAAGGALAALVTPLAFRQAGVRAWIGSLLVAGAALEAACVLPYRLPWMLLGALLLGFVAQAIKISVDTLIQQQISDAFRGRVFSVYDALINLTLVAAAVITAVVLPENGLSRPTVLVITVAYLLTAGAYLRVSAARPTTA
jgi:MFS family permease